MSQNQPTRPRYRYRTVSGASEWGALKSLPKARQHVCALRVKHPEAEVERVLELPGGARRYWRWRGGRWSFHNMYDPTPADLAKWDYAPSIAEIVNG